MATPYQAIVRSGNGLVTDVIVCDQETADLFAGWDLFPGCSWHNVTDVTPRPAPGWSYVEDRAPQWRPPAPGPDWTWNDDDEQWDAPPPPDPDPEPEPTPEPEPIEEP